MNHKLWIVLFTAAMLAIDRTTAAHEGHDHADAKPATTQPSAKDEHDHDHDHGDEHDDHDHDHADDKPAASQPAAHDDHGHDHDDHDHGSQGDHGHDHAGHDHGDEKGHADEVKLTADAIRRSGIVVATAKRQGVASMLVAPGRVEFNGDAVAHVGSAVAGRVSQVTAKVGDAVKAGDELLIIESPELGEAQSDFLQKRAAVTVAESAVEPAKESYERAKKLFDQSQGIALAEVQKRHADFRAAEGSLLTASAASRAAENKLRLLGMSESAVQSLEKSGSIDPKFAVRSPIAGQVVEREVTLGELVSPDKEALIVIADPARLWVWADVPEAKLGAIHTGAAASITTAAATKAVEGKIAHISPQLDVNTRTGRVRIDVTSAGGLRPGMFARVELAASDASASAGDAVIAVPAEAVQTLEGNAVVFVVVPNEANTFAARVVKVGRGSGGLVPILSGLKEGESFVAEGSFVLKADLGKSGAAHEH